MFMLGKIAKDTLNEYKDKVLERLLKRIQNTDKLTHSAKSKLVPKWESKNPDTSKIEELLLSEPKELLDYNSKLMADLNRLRKKNRPSNKELLEVFDYDGVFNNTSKSIAFWLSKKIGKNTCTYCNRQYIFTIVRNGGRNKNDRIARPCFDHYFPKSKYPLLSLSIYNLIPSCSLCNSSLKGGVEMNLNEYIHPYVPEPSGINFSFKLDYTYKPHSKWELRLDREDGSKEDNTIKAFALDEIYSMHNDLEVNDIIHFLMAYPEGYISLLMDKLIGDSTKLSRLDVYRMLFGTELETDKFLDRPLSKMKYDILKSFGVIK